MDLRTLPEGLSSSERCDERRRRIEEETGANLDLLGVNPATLGNADEKNCEQMFGQVPIPVGYAGPLSVHCSSGESVELHLPLATTEGALVASVNRGCKALAGSGGVTVQSERIGITRSPAFKTSEPQNLKTFLNEKNDEWKTIAESSSDHLKLLSYTIDTTDDHLFLTIACDTDEAMGMNMVTIAAQKIGEWIVEHFDGDVTFVTVAGNVDSDKKPCERTVIEGRGYKVKAEATVSTSAIETILKSTPDALLAVAEAKLHQGSKIAGALGINLHAANVIAALYLATGQDAAHVVEGSLTDTHVEIVETCDSHVSTDSSLRISVNLPAILVGIRGGGTGLPAQKQCLDLLLKPATKLHPCQQLAESIGAAVLAGEISLLAAQAGHDLAKAHTALGR